MSDTIIAALITVAAVVLTALGAYFNHRRTAARRSTLTFISRAQLESAEWREQSRVFRDLRKANKLPALLTNDSADPGAVTQVCLYLSHFELVAVGIRNKIIDKKLYSEWFRGTYIATWDEAKAFVVELRRVSGNDRIFVEFERLADEWAREDRKS